MYPLVVARPLQLPQGYTAGLGHTRKFKHHPIEGFVKGSMDVPGRGSWAGKPMSSPSFSRTSSCCLCYATVSQVKDVHTKACTHLRFKLFETFRTFRIFLRNALLHLYLSFSFLGMRRFGQSLCLAPNRTSSTFNLTFHNNVSSSCTTMAALPPSSVAAVVRRCSVRLNFIKLVLNQVITCRNAQNEILSKEAPSSEIANVKIRHEGREVMLPADWDATRNCHRIKSSSGTPVKIIPEQPTVWHTTSTVRKNLSLFLPGTHNPS
jgi:hypothetical protein